MRLNIVTETEAQRWSLRYDAENLAQHIDGATVSTEVDPTAQVNLFVNYALYKRVNTLTAAMFTHLEELGPLVDTFFEVAHLADHCFAMCQSTLVQLPNWKASIMTVWPDAMFYRDNPLQLGICGRGYESGRKQEGWITEIAAIPGVNVTYTAGKLDKVDLPAWYDSLNYLVVISRNEGGPKAVPEALARGVPVIAPDVGYCWDFPVIRYRNKRELLELITGLVIPRDGWAQTANHVQSTLERLIRFHTRPKRGKKARKG